MSTKKSARRRAIIRRNIFLSCCAAVLLAVVILIVFVLKSISAQGDGGSYSSDGSAVQSSSESASSTESTGPEYVQRGEYTLDADYTNLMLVNADNPLPDNYDTEVREYLVEIDPQYRNNDNVTQIHKDIYPYITAMVAAAQADGVDLRVWSPFRSYDIQKQLFEKQVARVGGDEAKAATVVARPGTSEHNTGLCADFNMASDTFETTEMYKWMKENAADYGFIMRYSAEKQFITGIIPESWHWRFVGIKAAAEINSLGMCLEEYVDYLNGK